MILTKEEFEDRGNQFWDEIRGIVELLNKTNRAGFFITDHRDPTVTQYLLWRILIENKVANQKPNIGLSEKLKSLFDSI